MAASAETKARVLALLNPQSTPEQRPRSAPGAIRRGARAAATRERLKQKRTQDSGGGGILGDVVRAHVGPVSVGDVLEQLDKPRRGVVGATAYASYLATGDEHDRDIAHRAFRGEWGGSELLSEELGVDNKYAKAFGGFALDVASDPLTYVAVGAPLRGGSKTVSQRLLREAPERLATKYADDAGVSLADKFAAPAIRAEAQRVAEEQATRVARYGGSSLSADEALASLGTRGGIRFTVPGTGRIGRKLTHLPETQLPIVPKAVTDPLTHAVAGARTAARESRWGRALGERLGGEEMSHALSVLAKSGDSRIAVPAMKTLSISQTEQARSAVIFRELTREYGKNVRPKIKHAFDTVVDAAESGAKEGAPLRDFFGKVADEVRTATKGAIDLRRDGDYVPLIETKAGRAARTAGKQVYEGAGGYNPTTKSRLRALFGDSAARTEFEQFAKEKFGLSASYFERHPDKIVPIYLQVLERKVARELTLQRMAAEGIVQPGIIEKTVLNKRNLKLRTKLGNQVARAEQRATGAKDRARELLGQEAQQTTKVMQRAAAPVEGPPVGAVDDVDQARATAQVRDIVAQQKVFDTVTAPFDAMGVRRLRRLAKDQGIRGADRMRKAEIVDALGGKALNRELKGATVLDDAAAQDYLDFYPRLADPTHRARMAEEYRAAERELGGVGEITGRNGQHTEAAAAAYLDDMYGSRDLREFTQSARESARAFDPNLLRAHDLVMGSATRKRIYEIGPANMDPVDLEKWYDSVEGLVRRSGDEGAGFHLERAYNYLVNGDTVQAVRELENAISTVHSRALFGAPGQRTPEHILEQFPHLADPKARNTLLDGLNQSVDQETANVLDEIDALRANGFEDAANELAASLPDDVREFGELSAVGGIHIEADAARQLNEMFGTANLKYMLEPALDVDALNREVIEATRAARDAERNYALAAAVPDRATLLQEQAKQATARRRYLTAAQRESDRELKKIAVLEARRAQAEELYLKETKRALSLEKQRAALSTTRVQKQASQELLSGAHKFVDSWSGRTAPAEIADALARVSKVNTSEGWSKFLHHYDSFLNYIKAWQISSPGFHLRNTMGGVFNNFLADIDPGAYNRYWRARMGLFSSDADRAAFAEWRKFGSVGQFGSHEVTTGLKHENLLTRVNPLSSKNAYVHANQVWGSNVEDMLRGSLFMDVFKKTGDADQALDAVYKFHFNYDDLSQFERSGVRRVFPFYTWTRKNFPLQVQMMVERPGKYAWYAHFDENVRDELGEPEGIVPSYYGDLWAIPTGIDNGGGQMYLTPDLPFTRTMTEPIPWEDGKPSLNPLLSQMTPIIKTPLERIQQHQYFKNIPLTDRKENAPDAWDKIPGLMGGLRELGVVDKKGKIAQDDAYTIEQYVPLLGRMRRLFASEKKYQDRAQSTWLSFLGVPLRTNTAAEKKAERFRRYLARTEEQTYRVPKKDR